MPVKSVQMSLTARREAKMTKDTIQSKRSVHDGLNEKRHLFCKRCGKEFIPKRRHHIFCSSRCRAIYNRKYTVTPLAPIFCLQCGKNFSPTKKWQKFCGRDCKNNCSNFIEALFNTFGPNSNVLRLFNQP